MGRLLTELQPEPEVIGLLSLMLLHESRRAARTSPAGELILLENQDHSLWNREQIAGSGFGGESPELPPLRCLHTAGYDRGRSCAMFDACFEYDDHLRVNGNWAGGEALLSQETALPLYWKNGKVATTGGPYAETKEQLGCILVLEARDMNHAVQLMAQRPAMTYGNIFQIRPVGDMNEIMKASEQRRQKGNLAMITATRERMISKG